MTLDLLLVQVVQTEVDHEPVGLLAGQRPQSVWARLWVSVGCPDFFSFWAASQAAA
ncbi:hypothetical protein ACIQB5_47635 [Streptomyces sp. NPDC088560]|uniref:hypothetical protein n=1 Tax=Streptomyces sp. NPDC088560 TaxID=3365868 RepID=UPI0038181D9F